MIVGVNKALSILKDRDAEMFSDRRIINLLMAPYSSNIVRSQQQNHWDSGRGP